MFKNDSEWTKVMKRTLTIGMGLKDKVHYNINNDGVALTPKGMDKIIENFDQYKKYKRWQLGYKNQNSPL
ncbi:MAG: hypothetical protein WA055_00590 [Candidatus Moraniibacteriota bacterium]